MAWDEKEYIQNKLWDHFQFYRSATTGERIQENVAEDGKVVKFNEIRFHAGSAILSVEDLVLRISSGNGSEYNYTIVSHPLSGSTDYRFVASDERGYLILSDDHLVLSVNISNTVIMGITIEGWAVSGG